MAFSFSIKSISQLWNRFWFEPESSDRLIVFRFIIFFIAPLYLFYFSPSAQPASFYKEWQPISFYKLLSGPVSENVLNGAQLAWLATSLLAGCGFYFSITAKLAAACGLFYFGYNYNFGTVYHSVHMYMMVVLILSFSRIDKEQDDSLEHRWPLSLCFVYVAYVMFYCGLQKMYYGDGLRWVFSESFYLRMLTNPYHPPLNDWVLDKPLLLSQMMAFWGVIVVEVLSPLFLFHKTSRWLLFFIWSTFHIMVMLVYGSHKQFVSQVFCYAVILPIGAYRAWLPLKPSS